MANQSLEFDLQLFAEEGEPAEETAGEQGIEEVETSEDAGEQEEEFEVRYNHETMRVKKSEAPTWIQKGLNHDRIKSKADKYESALQKAARLTGYDSVDSYLQAVEDAEKQADKQRYEAAGINDPKLIEEIIDKHPVVKEARALSNQQRFTAEVQELAKEFADTFGREITPEDIAPEVMQLREAKGYSMTEAFFIINRKNFKSLLDESASKAASKAVQDHKRQSKRGVESSADAPLESGKALDFTAEEKAWAERRVKQGHYKSLKEAWELLRGKK